MIDFWGRNIDNVIAHYNFAKHLIYFFSKDSLKRCCDTNRIRGIFSFLFDFYKIYRVTDCVFLSRNEKQDKKYSAAECGFVKK